MIEFFGQTRK